MDIDARVVPSAENRLADVDADPDAEFTSSGQACPANARWAATAASIASRTDGKTAKTESPSVETSVPPLLADRLLQQREMVVQERRKCVAEPRDQARRALDVGHEERDGAGREVPHG